MSYSHQIKKQVVGFVSALLLTALVLPTVPSQALTEGSSDSGYSVGNAYYNSDYNDLDDESSVFRSLTWEEAVCLFEQEGNYLILFGGSWCPNTTAVIDYINEAAKAAGVTTVYNFDFRLDGSDSDSHIRESNSSSKSGAAYNYLYGELVTRYLTNLDDWVEYTADSANALTYTNAEGRDVTVPKVQVPFLFLYNKDNTVNHAGDSQEGKKYPIVYGFEKMLYRDVNGSDALFTETEVQDETTRVADYPEQLNSAIFSHIGESEGQLVLSAFTDADYIRLAYNKRSGSTVFEEDEQINIQPITYRQLVWLLRQKGSYLILLGGAWSADTRSVIRTVNDYAVANQLTVYTFDTKLDGGYAKEYWGYSDDLQILDSENAFANLYVDLVNEYLDNIESRSDLEVFYQINPEDESTRKTADQILLPYFFAYNKDTADEDGHGLPILGHVEMSAGVGEFASGVFDVIGAYAARTGISPKDPDGKTVSVPPTGETDGDKNIGSSDAGQVENGGIDITTRMIVAAVGIAVAISAAVYAAHSEKKKTSGSGNCC